MVHLTSFKPSKSAREVALDCLSRRALTHYELETRLKQKGFESSEVNDVLERMEKLGYLNDRDLAMAYSINRLKHYSRQRVQQDLQNRGLESQLIEQALELAYSSDDEFQQCLTLAKRWWVQEGKHWEQRIDVKQTKRSIPRELWLQQKVARKLGQRGYSSEMVRDVLYQIKTDNYVE
ncbi:RecX family transcriptional regulator [Desulfosporosinus sp. Sb-LF]|uniref:regulatory protein RecX n=1 Tax=Desulfosporosinus sp. Sb-LF TaxID=2560027 RepID=UPI00107F3757|nr:RecX family transcriptional regulator [Desulfosporosinus sp. Sb-LF]TGE32263.1 regulatory protein RecX [Desulfosporosinus sp. Sb-LF]